MTVEADGVFYTNVISITQSAVNKAALVMPEKTVEVSIFSPIQIIGGINESDIHRGKGRKKENPRA